MTQRANILQELNQISNTLANISSENIYSVPEGYFENFAEQIFNRIKAMEAKNAKDELNYLSPVLNNISKEIPFSVPADYFYELEENLMQSVRVSEDYQTPIEELESISPFLSQLSKQTPYQVPQGYFENLNTQSSTKPKVKIVSISSRKWFRYAAAAMVVGIIALSGLLFFNKKPTVDPNTNPDEWITKNVKKLNTDKLDAFIKLDDEEHAAKETSIKTDEIKELMKDVSEKEIQQFLNETASSDDSGNSSSLN